MRPIEIDFDIHKLIEAERRGFDEPPNSALRRLLKLPEKVSTLPTMKRGRAWQSEGVSLAEGTQLRMTYGRPKRTYTGTIVNGEWHVEGQVFDSPSGAASGVAITGKGNKTRLNGWDLWEVQHPGEMRWIRLSVLRLA
jgi:hypothetical protein